MFNGWVAFDTHSCSVFFIVGLIIVNTTDVRHAYHHPETRTGYGIRAEAIKTARENMFSRLPVIKQELAKKERKKSTIHG